MKIAEIKTVNSSEQQNILDTIMDTDILVLLSQFFIPNKQSSSYDSWFQDGYLNSTRFIQYIMDGRMDKSFAVHNHIQRNMKKLLV